MIHVCFPLYDKNGNYSKYEGVAICSLLENTKSQITIHIIHDETVSDINIRNFRKLVISYDQRIELYKIEGTRFKEIEHTYLNYSVGTLFRLMIPSVLPSDVIKVIYLDADLVFDLDIKELWDIDLDNNVVAGRLDFFDSCKNSLVCKKGLVPLDNYFNAGVMVLNLEKIRMEYHLLDDCLEFLKANPQCTFCDQDAMNVLFQGKVRYINNRYNMFTIPLRNCMHDNPVKAIYHFAGDYVHIRNSTLFDRLFLSYLAKTPWGTPQYIMDLFLSVEQVRGKQEKSFQSAMKRLMKNKGKKIIFGAQSVLKEDIFNLMSLNLEQDYYIDNNIDLQNSGKHAVPVYNPDRVRLEKHGDFLVIVLSKKHYAEIAEQLRLYGLEEYEDFIDGRLLTGNMEMRLK